jgi:hypothetical protein
MNSARGCTVVAFLALTLANCGSGDSIPGQDALVRQVERGRIGRDTDQWVEIKNMAGEWEKTGLIFGYGERNGDYEECLKAIAGRKKVNYARKYRCSPAN